MDVLRRLRVVLALRRCARVGAAPDVRGRIWIHGGGAVRLGDRVRLDAGAAPIELHAASGAEIVIGDDAVLEGGTSIEARRSVTIGPRARLGPFCKVLDNDFHGIAARQTAPESLPVRVEADARIGERCILLPGAHVRQGATVRAGAVLRGPPRAPRGGEVPPARRRSALWRALHQLLLAIGVARGAVALRRAELEGRAYAMGRVRLGGAGRIRVGDRTMFVGGMIPTSLVAHGGAEIVIGERCIFNYGAELEARAAIRVGRRCMIASGVRLSDDRAGGAAPITVEDGVWLAHGVVVSPGVTVGEGSVVSAGSVVTRDVPPFSLAAGNPARCVSLALAAGARTVDPGARPGGPSPAAAARGEPAPERALDAAEALFHAFNSASAYLAGCVAAIEGPLDADLLARALAHVQRRHRLLGARIIDLPDGPRFAMRGEAPPALRVPPPGAPADPATLLEEQLHAPYAEEGPLWRCTFAAAPRAGALHHLSLGVHHAVADGQSVFRIVTDLLATCGALVEGRPLPPLLPPSPPLDEVLPAASTTAVLLHRLRRLRLRLTPGKLDIGHLPVGSAAARRSHVVLRETDAGVLASVETRCRAEGATVEGALTAALLGAFRERWGPRRSIKVGHQVSLRRSCRPPIGPESIGCFVVGAYTQHALSGESRFWDLARDATRQLKVVTARGITLAGVHATRRGSWRGSALVRRSAENPETLGRVSLVGISNRGRLPSVRSGPFALRAYYSGSGNHVIGNLFQLSCGSLDGRLMCTLVWVEPLADADAAERLLDDALARLVLASGAAQLSLASRSSALG